MKQPATLAFLAALLFASAGSAQGQDTYNGRNIRFLYINDISQMTSVEARSKLQQLQSAGVNVIPIGGPIGQLASQLSAVRQDPLLSRFKIMLSINNATYDGWNNNKALTCSPGTESLPATLQSDIDLITALGKANADMVVGYYAFDEPALSGICKRYQELVYQRIRQSDPVSSARPVVIANTMYNLTASQVAERMSADAQDLIFIDQYTSDESVQTQYFNLWKSSGVLQDPVVYILPSYGKPECIDPQLRTAFQPRLDAALNSVYGNQKPVSYGFGYFSFWANYKNTSDFTHDIDNCAPMLTSTIDHITQRADLKIERIETIPVDFRPGDTVQLRVRIRNAGSVATPNGWHGVLVRENGACFASGCAWGGFTGSLGAGQETDIVINGGATWQPGAGLKRLEATVDDQYLIQETRDDNNTFVREIAVGDKADLVTWGLTTTPSSFTPGTPVTFSTWVENRGSMSTPNGWLGVLYTVNNACPASGCIWGGVTASLAPGQGMWIQTNSPAPWSATAGSHVIRAVVDDSGQVPEYSESNNVIARDLIVSDKPDLRILSVRTEPALPRAGDAVSFVATVENRGSVALSAPWLGLVAQQNNACFVTGCVWGGQQNASLAPGQSGEIRTYSSAWQATSGQHLLQVRVDDGGNIPEADESNNMIEVPIFVP